MILEMQERADELKQEIQQHNFRINQANQIVQQETKEVLMKSGGLIELETYLEIIEENGK